MFEEKDLQVPKIFEKVQQNTYDRANKSNTIPEALTSNRKKMKEEPIHKKKHTQERKIRKKNERKTKKNKLADCNAPKWNPSHKRPARETKYHRQ